MNQNRPVPGAFYRHFKGNIYQVRTIAKHSESGEEMVVYQAMYPPFETWVRPLSMFTDRLDRTRYPEAAQEYRFVEVRFQKEDGGSVLRSQNKSVPENGQTDSGQLQESSRKEMMAEPVSDEELREILINDQGEKRLTGRMPEEEIARRGFLALLDAETYREKRQILTGMSDYINELYLNNLAAALDIVLEEGSSQEHYDTLLHCLETYEKYEGGRLRR